MFLLAINKLIILLEMNSMLCTVFQSSCREHNSVLAEVESKEEGEFLRSLALNATVSMFFFLIKYLADLLGLSLQI